MEEDAEPFAQLDPQGVRPSGQVSSIVRGRSEASSPAPFARQNHPKISRCVTILRSLPEIPWTVPSGM